MKCRNCGVVSGIQENDKFCRQCGAILKPLTDYPEQSSERMRIFRKRNGEYDVTLSHLLTSKVTDYELISSAHGGTKLKLTIDIDDSSLTIETAATIGE